jgi:hypothetical protein
LGWILSPWGEIICLPMWVNVGVNVGEVKNGPLSAENDFFKRGRFLFRQRSWRRPRPRRSWWQAVVRRQQRRLRLLQVWRGRTLLQRMPQPGELYANMQQFLVSRPLFQQPVLRTFSVTRGQFGRRVTRLLSLWVLATNTLLLQKNYKSLVAAQSKNIFVIFETP